MSVVITCLIMSTIGADNPPNDIGSASPEHSPGNHAAEPRFDFIITSPAARILFDPAPNFSNSDYRIELFCKLEDESTWQSSGTFLADKPISVRFDREGPVLIKLVPVAVGPSTQPAGPDANVYRCLVDWTAPIVNFISATQTAGKVVLKYLAYDPHLPVLAVQFYLVNEAGQKLLTQTTNTGWAELEFAEESLPGKIKIVVTDLAGNCSYAVSNTILPSAEDASTMQIVEPVTADGAGQPTTQRAPSVQSTQPAKTVSPEARWHYKVGLTYKSTGESSLAEYHLRQATKDNPGFIEAHVELADLLLTKGRYNGAEKLYLHVLSMDDRVGKAWQGLGQVCIAQGKIDRARQCFEKLTDIEQDNARGWVQFGDACWMLGQRGEALDNWQRARKLAEEQHLAKLAEAIDKRCELSRQP